MANIIELVGSEPTNVNIGKVQTNVKNVNNELSTVSQQLEHKADKPTVGRYTGNLFDINGDCAKIYDVGYLATVTNYPPNAPPWATLEYTPFWTTLAKLTWIDYSSKGTVFECMYNPTTKTVVQEWKTIATTDKVDISSTLVNGWVIRHIEEVGLEISISGKVVNIVGGIKNGVVTVSTSICTIPVGYRPSKEIYAPVSNSDGSAMVLLRLMPSGSILIANAGAAWVPGGYYFNITYAIN